MACAVTDAAGEKAPVQVNDGYAEQCTRGINRTIVERRCSAGNKNLVQFIGEGVEARRENADKGVLSIPRKATVSRKSLIKEGGENRIVGEVSELPDEKVEVVEDPAGDVQVNECQRLVQNPLGCGGAKGTG